MCPLIELEHLVDALKGFVRPLREGREAVNNIVFVGKKDEKESVVKVEALCVRTTKIHEEPIKIEVQINKKSTKINEKIVSISCSCPAGASNEHCCKHAMATLIYLEKHDENELESLTCTGVEQVWGKLKDSTLSRFDPVPIQDFCHVKKQPTVYRRTVVQVTSEMQEEFKALLIADQPESEAAVFLSGVREPQIKLQNTVSENKSVLANIVRENLEKPHFLLKKLAEITADLYSKCSPVEKEYYDAKIRITSEEAVRIYLETVGQDNDAWERSRFGRITGSICYSLYTYSSNKNPKWEKKLDSVFSSSFQGNENTQRGLMFEEDARECYSRSKENVEVLAPGILIHSLVPWLGFSADGIVFKDQKVVCLWECKTPKAGTKNNAEKVKTMVPCLQKNTGKLKERHPYYGQVQLGMLLYSLPVCDFTLYCCGTDEIFVNSVMFNEKLCLNMTEALAKVYFEHVLPYLCSRI